MNNAKLIFSFVVGAATGAVVTWRLLDAKYKRIAQEEIDSVKEVFSRREKTAINLKSEAEPEDTTSTPIDVQLDVRGFSYMLSEENYTNYSTRIENKKEALGVEKPYIITADEFAEYYDYNVVHLTYYADGEVADEDDELLDDVDYILGTEFMDHFGESADETVFVRNDALKTDYDIVYDPRRYSDITEE